MPRTPGINAVLERLLADDRADLHVALPGVVQSYDPATQTASIKPMVQRVVREQDDERAVDPMPVLPAVPVVFARGGGYFMTFPLVAGDAGLLVFCERDPGPWRHTGQDSDPGDEGLHWLTGAVLYPWLETEARALPTRPGHLVVGKEGGPELHIDGSHVDVGAAGGNFVALSNLVSAQLAALKSAINGWTPVPNDGGAALKVALTSWLGSSSATAATIPKAT